MLQKSGALRNLISIIIDLDGDDNYDWDENRILPGGKCCFAKVTTFPPVTLQIPDQMKYYDGKKLKTRVVLPISIEHEHLFCWWKRDKDLMKLDGNKYDEIRGE